MDVLFLMSIFRLFPGLKLSIEHSRVRENLILSARFNEMLDFLYVSFGGTIRYGDFYLEFLFRHFKVFRLHALLHDAAGAVWAHSGKGRDYCYMIG